MSGIYRIFTTILSFHAKMWVIASAAIISALLSVFLNFIFIPLFGQWAAAWASFFSVLGYTAWLFYWSQKFDPIKINYRLILTSILISAVLLAIEKVIEINQYLGFWIEFCLKIFLSVLYFIMIFFLQNLVEVKILNIR